VSALRAVVPTRILLRWDALAAAQLCETASRQAAEITRLRVDAESLRGELQRADECIDFWREQALDMQLQLCARTRGEPGITLAGELVVAPVTESPTTRG
jgi:hypothetical protein